MIDELKKDAAECMQKSVAALSQTLAKIRTGRAHPSLLEQISVSYYGSSTPLNQVANVAVDDARGGVWAPSAFRARAALIGRPRPLPWSLRSPWRCALLMPTRRTPGATMVARVAPPRSTVTFTNRFAPSPLVPSPPGCARKTTVLSRLEYR